jgi:hypothetical protein
MRLFASLLVIAAAAYIAFVVIARYRTSSEATSEPETTTGEVASAGATAAFSPHSQNAVEPAFKSRIPILMAAGKNISRRQMSFTWLMRVSNTPTVSRWLCRGIGAIGEA